MMTDYQSQIESQRGKLKELLLKVPGFKGYIELEDRRTADKLLRDAVADSYQEQLDRLTAVQTVFVDRGDLVYVDDLEAVVVKLRTFIDRISHATYGYSSFFSAVKIDAEKLDKIYDYDQALFAGIDSLSDAIENLETTEDPEQLKALITDLKKQARDIVAKADKRKDVITSEDEITSDGEIIEGEFVSDSDDEVPSE
jgi:hypothetical protein